MAAIPEGHQRNQILETHKAQKAADDQNRRQKIPRRHSSLNRFRISNFKKYDDFYVADLWSALRNSTAPHYSTDGGKTWSLINDDNLLLFTSAPIIQLD